MKAKNANCHDITTFFLYFSFEVIFNNLAVINIVKVVQIKVIIDNINGNIELVSNQICAVANVPGISTELPNKNVINNIIIHPIIHAIKLQREFISTSWNSILFGQKFIIYLLFL
jgi:hypothetical protein